MQKSDLRNYTLSEMESLVLSMGENKFRAKQIYEWINKKLVTEINDMTNLSNELKAKLNESSYISSVAIKQKLQSGIDSTIKYLFELEKNTIIEGVLMKYEHGLSACLSTQAGCRMGCAFCASTIGGLERNLTAGEICAQLYAMQRGSTERISGIVLMGSGEPFDNFDNVMRFIEIVNSKEGLQIGQRHITISTCGITERIYDFAEKNMQVNLAISLHGPNDKIRRELMPIAKKYSVNQILEACRYYSNRTKRRVTYEYALISGVNDSLACAQELGIKIKSTLSHVNLIPVNEVKERKYQKSDRIVTEAFAEKLKSFGIETTIRRKLGSDINGACGQLRRGFKEHSSEVIK